MNSFVCNLKKCKNTLERPKLARFSSADNLPQNAQLFKWWLFIYFPEIEKMFLLAFTRILNQLKIVFYLKSNAKVDDKYHMVYAHKERLV